MAVEKCHSDPTVFVGVLKFDDIGFMNQVGIEDERSILSVGKDNGFGSAFLQKFLNLVRILVGIGMLKGLFPWSAKYQRSRLRVNCPLQESHVQTGVKGNTRAGHIGDTLMSEVYIQQFS